MKKISKTQSEKQGNKGHRIKCLFHLHTYKEKQRKYNVKYRKIKMQWWPVQCRSLPILHHNTKKIWKLGITGKRLVRSHTRIADGIQTWEFIGARYQHRGLSAAVFEPVTNLCSSHDTTNNHMRWYLGCIWMGFSTFLLIFPRKKGMSFEWAGSEKYITQVWRD